MGGRDGPSIRRHRSAERRVTGLDGSRNPSRVDLGLRDHLGRVLEDDLVLGELLLVDEVHFAIAQAEHIDVLAEHPRRVPVVGEVGPLPTFDPYPAHVLTGRELTMHRCLT